MKTRAFIFTLISLLLIGAPSQSFGGLGFLARTKGYSTGSPAVPLMAPSLAYNGTPGSGGTAPVDGVRTTAKPAILWLRPSDMRLVTNKRICVDADAKGGISRIDFWFEGTVATAAKITDTYTNALGTIVSQQDVYCVDLDASATRAVSTTGSAKLLATAYPNDTTMQPRTIGGPQFPAADPTYDTIAYGGNYPFTLYPRTAENDTSVTVCPSSCTYPTLQAAFNVLQATSFEAPLITITASGSYTLANATGTEKSSVNRAVITVAPGVSAVLGQTGITYNNPLTWDVRLGWDGVEFRGNPGGSLTIDQKWLRALQFASKPTWFNGITFTNSTNNIQDLYWNGNTAPPGGSTSGAYNDDLTITHTGGQLINARYSKNSTVYDTAGDVIYASHYAFRTRTDTYNVSYTASNVNGFTIGYTGTGVKSVTALAPATGNASAWAAILEESGANSSILYGDTVSGRGTLHPDSTATKGSAVVMFSGQPAVNDTITTGTLSGGVGTNIKTYTWVSGAPGVNQIQIGASLTASIANLVTATAGDTNLSVVSGSARFTKPNDVNTTGTLDLYVEGTLVQQIPVGVYSTDTNPTITALSSATNTFGTGWATTVINSRGPFRAASLGGIAAFSNFNAQSITQQVTVGYDPHAEWAHTYTGSATRQNLIWRSNFVINDLNSPFINNDAALGFDFIWKGNVWLGTNNNPTYVGCTETSHLVIENNTTNGYFARREYVAGNPSNPCAAQDVTYSIARNNVVFGVFPFGYSGSGSFFPSTFPWINTIYTPANSTFLLNGPNDTGSVSYSPSTIASQFVNITTGDVRPAAGSALLLNLFAPVNPTDQRGYTYVNPDAAGAWSKDSPAP